MSKPISFTLLFSEGSPWVLSFLKNYSKNLPRSEFFKISKSLYKTILKKNKEIEAIGHPSNLSILRLNDTIQMGVFLKPSEKPIPKGAFIGIYTGKYELVKSELSVGTSYAYDVAQNFPLTPRQLKRAAHPLREKGETNEYCIQTNALKTGNFTRFINHSSLENNIEAVISQFPDGRIEVVLFALKTIHPGEQLLSCYGGHYWKTLQIIPDDMTPRTYILTPNFLIKKNEKTPCLSPTEKAFLLPLRNMDAIVPDKIEKKALFRNLKDSLKPISDAEQAKIEAFEDVLVERGLPRNLTLALQKGKPRIYLKKTEKPVLPGHFMGVLAGTFTLTPSNTSFLVSQSSKTKLFLDLALDGNFFSALKKDSKQSNLRLELKWDEESSCLRCLVYCKKKIKPGSTLCLPLELV